jgi:hypothetical protein
MRVRARARVCVLTTPDPAAICLLACLIIDDSRPKAGGLSS